MGLVPAKCTQCGANINVDITKEAGICEYCGTAFITEKAVVAYNVENHINVNSSGNVINIVYNSPDKTPRQSDDNTQSYGVTISRLKRFEGSGVVLVFDVDGQEYELYNGGEIFFRTNEKELDIPVRQKHLSSCCGHFTAVFEGKDINVKLSITCAFTRFGINIISTNNKSVHI